jgi:hypothetical protein
LNFRGNARPPTATFSCGRCSPPCDRKRRWAALFGGGLGRCPCLQRLSPPTLIDLGNFFGPGRPKVSLKSPVFWGLPVRSLCHASPAEAHSSDLGRGGGSGRGVVRGRARPRPCLQSLLPLAPDVLIELANLFGQGRPKELPTGPPSPLFGPRQPRRGSLVRPWSSGWKAVGSKARLARCRRCQTFLVATCLCSEAFQGKRKTQNETQSFQARELGQTLAAKRRSIGCLAWSGAVKAPVPCTAAAKAQWGSAG